MKVEYTSDKLGTFLRLGQLWLAHNPWGNCFAPAIILDTTGLKTKPWTCKKGVKRYPAKATLVIRTRGHAETAIYWRGWFRFDWNSAHVARRFGAFIDTDFGGVMQYKGILGSHIDL
jgi:hypothetical protein